jgi:hypothetical protein
MFLHKKVGVDGGVNFGNTSWILDAFETEWMNHSTQLISEKVFLMTSTSKCEQAFVVDRYLLEAI